MIDPIAYYSPEACLFPALAQGYADMGTIDPMAFYLVLDWKAPRARTLHRKRLITIAGSFTAAVNLIAADLHSAVSPEKQLGLLLNKWGFRLPTASAILAVLCPETFTVYDIRVCDALGAFHKLGSTKWSSEAWQEYERFVIAVQAAAPKGLSLRDCDRWLWGQNKRKTLHKELTASS